MLTGDKQRRIEMAGEEQLERVVQPQNEDEEEEEEKKEEEEKQEEEVVAVVCSIVTMDSPLVPFILQYIQFA